MTTIDTVFPEIARHRDELRGLGVRRLRLFGSAARGEATDASDLDFVVDLDPKTFNGYMAIKELLEALFSRKVDLVTPSALKPLLRDRILSEAIDVPGF